MRVYVHLWFDGYELKSKVTGSPPGDPAFISSVVIIMEPPPAKIPLDADASSEYNPSTNQ